MHNIRERELAKRKNNRVSTIQNTHTHSLLTFGFDHVFIPNFLLFNKFTMVWKKLNWQVGKKLCRKKGKTSFKLGLCVALEAATFSSFSWIFFIEGKKPKWSLTIVTASSMGQQEGCLKLELLSYHYTLRYGGCKQFIGLTSENEILREYHE